MVKKIKQLGVLLILLCCLLPLASCAHSEETGISLYADRTLLFSTESGPALRDVDFSAARKLTMYNNTDEDASVTLYTAAAENGAVTLSAPAGKSASTSLSESVPAAYCDGVRLIREDGDKTYLLNSAGLVCALSEGAPDLLLLRDVTVDGDLSVTAPAALSTDGHTLSVTGVFSFLSNASGALTVDGDVTAAAFYARAPRCSIRIPDALIPPDPDFGVAAAALNGTPSDGTITVTSMEQLTALTTGAPYEQIVPGLSVRLSGFRVTAPVTFSLPVSLQAHDMTWSRSITVETEEAGSICIAGIPVSALRLTAPACDLIWEDGPPLHKVAELYDVDTYCGCDPREYTLGGTLSELPAVSLLTEENTYITEDLSWEPVPGDAGAYHLCGEVTGAASPSALRAARLSVTLPEGYTAAFSENAVNPDGTVDLQAAAGCYLTVSDGTASCRYVLETDCPLLLPVVIIETGGATVTREEYVDATVAIESDFSEGMPSLAQKEAQIRGRGNSTWNWTYAGKRPLKIKFSEKTSVLGIEPAKHWVLLSNYADKSLLRNFVALECAKVLDNMENYATQYPVDVFVDGAYMGVYTLGEQVEVADGRLWVKEDAGDANTGFLLEVGVSQDSGHPVFSSKYLRGVGVLYPKALSEEALNAIESHISMVEYAIINKKNYEDYLDVPSLVDWFLITELSYNADSCFRRSVFLTKGAREKLQMAQVWDFDLAFGNNVADVAAYGEWACLATEYGYVKPNWMEYLMRDEAFVAALRARWAEVKEELLETARQSVDEGTRLVAPSARNNFRQWNILSSCVAAEPIEVLACTTYEAQVAYLRDFIEARWQWMDAQLSE